MKLIFHNMNLKILEKEMIDLIDKYKDLSFFEDDF